VAPKTGLNLAEIENVIKYVLDEYGALNELVPIGEKWKGGNAVVTACKPGTKTKGNSGRSIFS
jgi:hypothetical protein